MTVTPYQYFTWITIPWKSICFILNQSRSVSHWNVPRNLKHKPLTQQLGKQVLIAPWLLLSLGLASSHTMAMATRAWGRSPVPYWRLSRDGHGGTCLPTWGTTWITPSNHFNFLSPNGKHCLNQGCTVGLLWRLWSGTLLAQGLSARVEGKVLLNFVLRQIWAEEKMVWLLKSSAVVFKGSKERK